MVEIVWFLCLVLVIVFLILSIVVLISMIVDVIKCNRMHSNIHKEHERIKEEIIIAKKDR